MDSLDAAAYTFTDKPWRIVSQRSFNEWFRKTLLHKNVYIGTRLFVFCTFYIYIRLYSVPFGITSSIETKAHTLCVCVCSVCLLADSPACITSIFSLCKRTSIERVNGEENNEHSIPSKKFANEYVDYAPWQYFNLVSVMIVRMSGNVDFCFGSVWFPFCYCNYYLLTWHPIHTFPTRCKEVRAEVYEPTSLHGHLNSRIMYACLSLPIFRTKLYSNLYRSHREIYLTGR